VQAEPEPRETDIKQDSGALKARSDSSDQAALSALEEKKKGWLFHISRGLAQSGLHPGLSQVAPSALQDCKIAVICGADIKRSCTPL
jgi:hypothetical protein